MLVLTMRPSDLGPVMIGGGVGVRILEVRGNAVRVGFIAPAEVKILRPGVVDDHRNESCSTKSNSQQDS